MKKFLATALLLIVGSTSYAAETTFRRAETFSDVHAASCRVRARSSIGSGTFVGFTDGAGWFFTNYHVVGKENDVKLDFWTNSKLETLDGKVSWRFYDVNLPGDFAFVKVDAKALKRIDPPYVPLAGPDVKPTEHGFIASSGCPDGRFAQAWRGEVVSYYNGKTAVFQPPPVPGQSGSGIVEYIDGKPYVVAILTWLFGQKGSDESTGGAIPVANLYLAADGRVRLEMGTDGGLDAIPPDATECGESEPVLRGREEAASLCFVVFKKTRCEPCALYENELKQVEEQGVKVVRIVRETESGPKLFSDWSVRNSPTTFVAAETEPNSYAKRKRLKEGVIPSAVLASELNSVRYAIYAGTLPLDVDVPIIVASTETEEETETDDLTGANGDFEIVDLNAPEVVEDEPEGEASSPLPEAEELVEDETEEEEKDEVAETVEPDFRDREPVHQSGMGLGILDKSRRDWDARDAESNEPPSEEKPESPKIEKRKKDSDSTGIAQRLADSIVDGALKSIDEKLSAKQDEIKTQFELFQDKVFHSLFLLVIIAFVAATIILRIASAILRWLGKRVAPVAFAFRRAMETAWQETEQRKD